LFAIVTLLAAFILLFLTFRASAVALAALSLLAGFLAGYLVSSRTFRPSAETSENNNEDSETSTPEIFALGKLFEATLGGMREGLLVVDSDLCVVASNPAAYRLFNFASGKLDSRRLTELTRNPAIYGAFLEALKGNERSEVKVEIHDPGRRVFDLRVVPLGVAGRKDSAGAIGVFFDITQLEKLERVRQEFLSNVSHELRTPLNVILGWTRMLLTDQLSEKARQHALELIDRNALAQAQLVNDLVDMSRMTTGKLQVELEPLPVVPVLEAALESVRPAAEAKEIAIHTSWRVHDANVLADATRLQQILWNLLSNAVKFTPSGGQISVSAERIDQRIRIEVADTGIGIDSAFLPHVFDRFRQADSATTRRHGGLGLGLAIVHELVQLHGGDVEVRSPGIGEGATFAVTFRASDALAVAADEPRPSRKGISLKGYSVMLLEDHADSRDLLVHALRNSGADVAAFGAADEAFAALDRLRPSVIVADIALPDEDGYSFIRRVRAHSTPAIQAIPAIAVTAYASVPDRVEALAVGFQQHLPKPIDPARLIQVIGELNRRPTSRRS
jgi:signal transduction histidine kinase/CheY-like chemotaxis protein